MKKKPVSKTTNVFLYILFLGLTGSLGINIIYSQTISPIYFKLINDDRKAAVEFLKKIKILSEFKDHLFQYKNVYGQSIEDEVFQEDNKREMEIKKLKELLGKSPKNRDILYSLYILYNDKGDQTKAKEYLNKAKEIDPAIEEVSY